VLTDQEFLDRVQRVFQEAADLDPASRSAYVRRVSLGDERLAARVLGLIQVFEKTEASEAWKTTAIEQFAAEALEADLDRYRLLEHIGSGGMGVVYKAVRADDEFSKLVAVKIVLLPDPAMILRLRKERQILAGLEHPNIARLLDGGTSKDGSPFLVMEYVDGIPINRYAQEGKLSTNDILALLDKVCAAVSYAHRNLIVHRDLKPANILVTADGEPKLLDFGIAKVVDGTGERTRTGLIAMTPEYASPEQIGGGLITTATDVYSLGVLLYELLTGGGPYRRGEGALELAESVVKEAPLPMSATAGRRFDPDLENIVQMALRKEPERRYASIDQFSEDLRRYMDGRPVVAHRDTLAYRANKFVRRNAVGVAAGGLLLVTLLAGIAGTAWQAHVAKLERARAERRFNDVRHLADSFLFEFNASIEGIPGTLAARQLIVKRALEYLDSLSAEEGNDAALKSELADAYQKVGTITFDVDARLRIHQKELAIRDSLARSDPANLRYQQDLATAYNSVGDATKDTGNLRGALENYRRALAIDLALSRKAPKDVRIQLDTANGFVLMEQTLQRTGQLDESLANGYRALATVQQAMDAGLTSPDFPQLLMVIHHSLARDLVEKGNLAGAMEQTRAALKLAEDMNQADPANATNRRNLWVSHMKQAEVLVKSGDVAAGLAHYREALPLIQALADADPGDKGHRRALAVTLRWLGDTLVASGDLPGALRAYQSAISTSEALLAADPHKLETRVDLAGMYTHLGVWYLKSGQRARALEFFEKGRAFFDEAAAADPSSAEIRSGKAEVYAQLDALKTSRAATSR